MSYCLVHTSVWKTIQGEPDVHLASVERLEPLVEAYEDTNASNLMDTAFVPLSAHVTIVSNEDDISDDDRWPAFVKSLNFQARCCQQSL